MAPINRRTVLKWLGVTAGALPAAGRLVSQQRVDVPATTTPTVTTKRGTWYFNLLDEETLNLARMKIKAAKMRTARNAGDTQAFAAARKWTIGREELLAGFPMAKERVIQGRRGLLVEWQDYTACIERMARAGESVQ